MLQVTYHEVLALEEDGRLMNFARSRDCFHHDDGDELPITI